jgi:ArsR family transcriptional regulator, arsenate/arsenite/antimonite-responsive transcriptional repressor
MADPENLARIIEVLSVGRRVQIIQLLKGRALCVNALAARLDVTQGAVSQHLRILRDAGLVTAEKRGCFVHYRLNGRALARCQALLDDLLEVPGEAESASFNPATKAEQPCANARTAVRDRKR